MLSFCIVQEILCCISSSVSENGCKKFSCDLQGIKFLQVPKNYEPDPKVAHTQDKASGVFRFTAGTLTNTKTRHVLEF